MIFFFIKKDIFENLNIIFVKLDCEIRLKYMSINMKEVIKLVCAYTIKLD